MGRGFWLGIAGGCAVAACGGVGGGNVAGDASDAALLDDGGNPLRPDAGGCQVDDFDGLMLDDHWQTVAGATIPHSILGSVFTADDAPFAETPSMPGTSWIFEPDTDLGNQIGWAHDIGTGDFRLVADFGWSSSPEEMTLAGIALTNSAHQLDLILGVHDGAIDATAAPVVSLRRPSTDLAMFAAEAPTGVGRFEVERVSGSLVVELNDDSLLSDASVADLRYVVIFAVRRSDPETMFTFGSFSVDSLSVCY
jgi:hypothetical protein